MIRESRSFSRQIMIAFGAAAIACSAAAAAQTYPSKQVDFVVHVNPGGGTDVFARLVTEIMTRDRLVTQPLVVLNRPGGAGVVAFTYVKSKRGDPHTVLTMATGSFLTAASRPDLDLGLEHFTPLAFFARDPQGIIVNTDSPYRTFKDLLDDAKKRPGEIVCAVLVLAEGATAPDAAELGEYTADSLARFKRPRRVEVVDVLPRTPATNQVQRRLLIERLTS